MGEERLGAEQSAGVVRVVWTGSPAGTRRLDVECHPPTNDIVAQTCVCGW